ncbi:hypothetical protein DRO97_06055 [Archaeoglobales archaeon]|nr:MAG: hypothetical protein DRO97_06055 [Archaeoglobales archaeon]
MKFSVKLDNKKILQSYAIFRFRENSGRENSWEIKTKNPEPIDFKTEFKELQEKGDSVVIGLSEISTIGC